MTGDADKALVRGFIEHVINQRNLDAAGDYMAQNIVELVPFPGQGPGLDGVRDVLRGLFSAFPDMIWQVDEQIAEQNRVMTRFSWTATHKGDFAGLPASGRTVSVWGTVIDRIENGRIQDTRLLMDVFGLAQQSGG